MSPEDTALFWVEYVLRNGHILRSPATKLNWYQNEILDIYCLILIVISLFIYTIFSIIKLFFKMINNSRRRDASKKKNK